jgi:hypothetical protein
MLRAIDFNQQALRQARKVDDESFKRDLSTEVVTLPSKRS